MADNLTNPDQSALTSLQKMQSSSIVGAINEGIAGVKDKVTSFTSWLTSPGGSRVSTSPGGAQSSVPQVNFFKANSDGSSTYLNEQDLRVKIRIPTDYYSSPVTQGPSNNIKNLKAIIFPYTPSITYEHKADYTTQNITHSNFALHFYQRSSVSAIQITGEFTVQNEADAAMYLSTVHILRALTKMQTGLDSNPGSPPPVCRLDAYGDYMLKNVPVAIASFRLELPNKVDYFTIGKSAAGVYGQTSVPTLSTLSINCIPIYSRAEMQKFSVKNWLTTPSTVRNGYQ